MEKVASEKKSGFNDKAVEDAIREELVELAVLEEIEEFLSKTGTSSPLEVFIPVKPKAKTRAEEVVRELRCSRT